MSKIKNGVNRCESVSKRQRLEKTKPKPAFWPEILNLKRVEGYVLKKQSQFVPGLIGATSY